MSNQQRIRQVLAMLATAAFLIVFAKGCGGGVGAECRTNNDCADGECCRDANCGGGMCTYACDSNRDCPDDMACEHGHCFFRCSDHDDCDPGQRCEHGKTICEYH